MKNQVNGAKTAASPNNVLHHTVNLLSSRNNNNLIRPLKVALRPLRKSIRSIGMTSTTNRSTSWGYVFSQIESYTHYPFYQIGAGLVAGIGAAGAAYYAYKEHGKNEEEVYLLSIITSCRPNISILSRKRLMSGLSTTGLERQSNARRHSEVETTTVKWHGFSMRVRISHRMLSKAALSVAPLCTFAVLTARQVRQWSLLIKMLIAILIGRSQYVPNNVDRNSD